MKFAFKNDSIIILVSTSLPDKIKMFFELLISKFKLLINGSLVCCSEMDLEMSGWVDFEEGYFNSLRKLLVKVFS